MKLSFALGFLTFAFMTLNWVSSVFSLNYGKNVSRGYAKIVTRDDALLSPERRAKLNFTNFGRIQVFVNERLTAESPIQDIYYFQVDADATISYMQRNGLNYIAGTTDNSCANAYFDIEDNGKLKVMCKKNNEYTLVYYFSFFDNKFQKSLGSGRSCASKIFCIRPEEEGEEDD